RCALSRALRHAPPAPLFPYTTLFRSDGFADLYLPELHHGLGSARKHRKVRPQHPVEDVLAQCLQRLCTAIDHQGIVDSRLEDGIDRKSTRLNSSHVKISYAVFCVKKK